MRKMACFLLFCLLTACLSTPPYKEYALARYALRAAKKSSADKFFPKTYSKAFSSYKKGANLYRQKNYEEAKNSFERTIELAEKAEFKARAQAIKETE